MVSKVCQTSDRISINNRNRLVKSYKLRSEPLSDNCTWVLTTLFLVVFEIITDKKQGIPLDATKIAKKPTTFIVFIENLWLNHDYSVSISILCPKLQLSLIYHHVHVFFPK